MDSQAVTLSTLLSPGKVLTPFYSLDKYSLDAYHVPATVLSPAGSRDKQEDGCQSPLLPQVGMEETNIRLTNNRFLEDNKTRGVTEE